MSENLPKPRHRVERHRPVAPESPLDGRIQRGENDVRQFARRDAIQVARLRSKQIATGKAIQVSDCGSHQIADSMAVQITQTDSRQMAGAFSVLACWDGTVQQAGPGSVLVGYWYRRFSGRLQMAVRRVGCGRGSLKPDTPYRFFQGKWTVVIAGDPPVPRDPA